MYEVIWSLKQSVKPNNVLCLRRRGSDYWNRGRKDWTCDWSCSFMLSSGLSSWKMYEVGIGIVTVRKFF